LIISLVMILLSDGAGVSSSPFWTLCFGVVEWTEVAGVVGAIAGVDSRDSSISFDEPVLFVDDGLSRVLRGIPEVCTDEPDEI
jgi:hypothetical protein